MKSRARLLGHPIHQTLVLFPLGLLAVWLVFDLLRFTVDDNDGLMAVMAHYMIGAGVILALLAAPFGTIDWPAIPKGTRARRIGELVNRLGVGVCDDASVDAPSSLGDHKAAARTGLLSRC